MSENTAAETVLEAIGERWSPTLFSGRPVRDDELRSLFEAARWAPSSMNEQPWRFLFATRELPEAFERMVSCLTYDNAQWARNAPLLMLVVTKRDFTRNDRENRHAWYDAGMATENLLVQAASMGMQGHVMAGFSRTKAIELFGILREFDTVAMIAIGFPGDADSEPEDSTARRREQRTRRPLDETVFTDRWGESPAFL